MTQQSVKTEAAPQNTGFALAVASGVFFLFGFGTSLNGVLQPHLKEIFNLNYAQSALVQSAFFSAYLVLSMPAAMLMAKLGYQKSMVLGLAVMGVGALLFFPAAGYLSYGVFLSAIFVLAGGVTALQVAANPFVTLLGDPARAATRLNMVQALNSVGQALAPYLGGLLFLATEAAVMSDEQKVIAAQAVKMPYLVMAIVLFVLAFALSRMKLNLPANMQTAAPPPGESIWKHSHLVLGALAIFAYVGAEVCCSSLMVNYLKMPEIGNVTGQAAAGYLSLMWIGMIVGRLAGGAVLRQVPGGLVLGLAGLFAMVLVLTSMFTTGPVAMWTILLVGFAESVMFPTIFALAVNKLGPLTGKGSGLINMAIVGGAAVPPIQGALADSIGLHMSFIIPVVCYLYIVFYGFVGSKVREPQAA